MNVWGWVAIGIVVLALILLALIALGTLRRLRPLQRAAADPEMQRDVTVVQERVAELSIAVADLQTRVATTQDRAMSLKASRDVERT